VTDQRWRSREENPAALGNSNSGPALERTQLMALLDSFTSLAGGIPLGVRELQFSPTTRALLCTAIPGEADHLLGYKIGENVNLPDRVVAFIGAAGVLKGWLNLDTGTVTRCPRPALAPNAAKGY